MHLAVAQPAEFEMDVFAKSRGRETQAVVEEWVDGSACLGNGDTGLEASEGAHVLVLRSVAGGRDIDLSGQQEIGGLQRGHLEIRRKDADHARGRIVDLDELVEDCRIAVVAALPDGVREEHGAGRVRQHVSGKEVAAEEGADAKGGEEIGVHVVAAEPHRIALSEVAGLRHGALRGHAGERRLAIAPVVEEHAEHELVRLGGMPHAEGDEAVGLDVGQWADEDAVDAPQDRRGCADGEREGSDDGKRETGVPTQGAEAVANVAAELVEDAEADGGAVLFVLSGGLAEIDARFAVRLFGVEALADEVFLIGREV